MRRLSLSSLFLPFAVAVGPSSSVCTLDTSNGDVLDVVIIGAGWAGMAAADHLVREASSPVSFLVLEASNQTGGRTQPMKFGDATGPGEFVIERGSNWICGYGGGMAGTEPGYPNVPKNKIYEIAHRIGLNMTFVPDGGENTKVIQTGGHDADPSGALRTKINHAYDCMLEKADAMEDSEIGQIVKGATVREAMSSCGWKPLTDVEWAFTLDMDENECNGNEDDFEAIGIDYTYEWWGSHDLFVIDQNPRGYARILDEMVKETLPEGDPRLVFNTKVVKLAYGGHCDESSKLTRSEAEYVAVTTHDGHIFRAREVIITLPFGVLLRQHRGLFSPPLPDNYTDLFVDGDLIKMRNVTRIALQFPNVWWDDTLLRWVYVNQGANDTSSAGEFNQWRNMNHAKMLPGSHILFCFLGDPQSSYYEALSDDEVRARVMRYLRKKHPETVIPDPTDFFITRHGYDETRYGAFSVMGTKWRPEANSFKKPLTDCAGNPRIHFAGEAMCSAFSGYTHGAMQSGKEVAAMYLYERGLGPNPDDDDSLCLCGWDVDDDDDIEEE